MKKIFFVLIISATMPFSSWAQTHKGITFQGVIKLNDGTYPTVSGLVVNAKVLSPTNCILREEEFSSVNLSNGYINLVVGSGARLGSDPNLTMAQIMNNSGTITPLVCLDGSGNVSGVNSYNPSLGTGARKLRIHIATLGITADFNMRALPFAINAETLNGNSDTSFIKVTSNVTQTALDNLLLNTALQDVLAGTYAAPAVSGTVAVANGGTGATSASAARTNLGLSAIASSGSASDLASGTVPTARLGTGTASNTTFLRGDGTWASIAAGGVTSVSGKTGTVVLSLADIKDGSGTAYFDNTLECANGSALKYNSVDDKLSCVSIVINASAITAGTLPLARGGTGGTDAATARTSLGLAAIASSGSASDLSAGTVPTARLGSGTADNTTYLRGDGSWQNIIAGVSSVNGLTGTVVLRPSHLRDGTGAVAALPTVGCAANQSLVYVSATDLFVCQDVKLSAADVTSGTLSIARGGTGGATAIAGFNALSPMTTKGDLVAFDGTNNLRLPAGTDSYVLTANSATATGLEWKAVTGTGDFLANGTIPMTGQFQAKDGIAAAPGISFSNDPDTGFNANGNILSFVVGGSTRGTINNNGWFSINSRVLGARFTSGNGSAQYPAFGFQNYDNMGMYGIGANILGFSTDSTERMRISATGNVGIATNNPLAPLHVEGIIRAQQLCDEAGANCKDISTGWSGGSGDVVNGGNTGALVVGTNDATSLTLETSGTARMTVAATGTTTFASPVRLPDGTSGAPSIGFSSDTSTGLFAQWQAVGVSANGAHVATLSNDSIESYRQFWMFPGNQGETNPGYSFSGDTNSGFFHIGADTVGISTAGAERVRVGSTGDVRIGSAATPGAKLDVGGTVKLGTNGGVLTGMGSCSIASAAWTAAPITGQTCTGIPSATAMVFCSPVTPQSGQTYAAKATAANTVTIVASTTGTTALSCYWVQP